MLLLWAVVRPLSPSVFSTLLWDVVLLLSSPVFDLLWAIVTALRPLSSAVFSTLLWPSSDPSRSPVSRRCCEMSFFPSRHPSSLSDVVVGRPCLTLLPNPLPLFCCLAIMASSIPTHSLDIPLTTYHLLVSFRGSSPCIYHPPLTSIASKTVPHSRTLSPDSLC